MEPARTAARAALRRLGATASTASPRMPHVSKPADRPTTSAARKALPRRASTAATIQSRGRRPFAGCPASKTCVVNPVATAAIPASASSRGRVTPAARAAAITSSAAVAASSIASAPGQRPAEP
jgi:hypothetical protein